ncbi:glycosyltransferase [Nesterenkonia flava]|uniref:Glycosyltransferase n=1 Tax=Nesterenkonia flava TaxID=469799 RepID=A0ABU1FQ40_9MICC|nr:glycosyltransferase [Nesterenkonia flava]MDR5710769.1 glycosyltransferase [Nesterenkonia flava]
MAQRVVAYAAGDHRIVFPAVVALTSIEKHNPGNFHKLIAFDGSHLTDEHSALMSRYDIEFIDARTVPDFNRVKSMPLMQEGRWPAEVFLNWAMPEHLATLGHRYSVKIDYDVVCVASFQNIVEEAIAQEHYVAYRRLKPTYKAPTPEVAQQFLAATGREFPTIQKINVGVALFDNEALQRGRYFDEFLKAYGALMEIAPQMHATEQVALAAVSTDYGQHFVPLPASMNRFARPFKSKFEPEADVRIVHYNGDLKPWKVIEPRHHRMAERRGQISPLLLRELWLKQAETVDGFEDYTDARSVGPMELLIMARRLEKNVESLKGQTESGSGATGAEDEAGD